METFYLIDFENVHNEGLENIDSLSKNDHVHIFSTENALNIRMDIVFSKGVDIQGHIVPVRKQSLDMHLVSYLGRLLGINGKQCSYVIVSKDKDYDNIIKFWKEEGYPNISRKQAIPGNAKPQEKSVSQKEPATTQATNSKISAGMAYNFSGEDRSELNVFMQHGLASMGYASNAANRICKYVIAHCNDEQMLSGIHNDLMNEFDNYIEIYEDVKVILENFVSSKSKIAKRESTVRSFFGQHFRKKIYVDRKEDIISIILNAQTRQQVNNGLLKLYSDGNVVKHIYQTVQPLIKDLPGN
ncbi:MAG: PIN domain-containing protein [Blautia sp.]|nr:PIN domain-containing protein [Lachnoclostridium sp.]MCM1212071.1 PIN domain-containing protein [Blautia sp.]